MKLLEDRTTILTRDAVAIDPAWAGPLLTKILRPKKNGTALTWQCHS